MVHELYIRSLFATRPSVSFSQRGRGRLYYKKIDRIKLSAMYGHTYSKGIYQPGKVANLARGQLNTENEYFPVRVRA